MEWQDPESKKDSNGYIIVINNQDTVKIKIWIGTGYRGSREDGRSWEGMATDKLYWEGIV